MKADMSELEVARCTTLEREVQKGGNVANSFDLSSNLNIN